MGKSPHDKCLVYGWNEKAFLIFSELPVIVPSWKSEPRNACGSPIRTMFAPVEAVAMTPDEWERDESFVVDFARHGEVLYAA